MEPDRWQRIESLYHSALQLGEERRGSFLEEACSGDAILRQEVESLLAHHSDANNFLEVPVLVTAAQAKAENEARNDSPVDNLGLEGRTVSHFHVLKKLGGGGMGVVYQAKDIRLNRFVALKFLLEDVSRDPRAVERFELEAQTASALNHPNICTIYDVDKHDGRPFIAMELLNGQTLRYRIASRPMKFEQVSQMGLQIADALDAAHGRGIVHRDIKPANIFVTERDQVKVLDFGLAKLLGPIRETALTESLTGVNMIVGTVPYMAPEQLRGQRVDARADIYALGTVLYEMATGERPFRGEPITQLIADILHKPPVRPRNLNPEMHPSLERVILKCLKKEPGNRYQSAKDLMLALQRLTKPAKIFSGRAARISSPRAKRGIREKRIESLVVLPLTNLSGDPQQEYFADGMTETLIADLARLRALRVISRTSAMRYKGTNKSLPEIAGELKVDAVIEGSVLRVGQRVRITAQLIQAATDTHLWAQSYERDLQDVLLLQSEVAQAIAREIQIAVTPEEMRRLARAGPVNPEAYEAYLKGRFHYYKLSPDHIDTALEYFQMAQAKDPHNALPYVGIGDIWSVRGDIGIMPPREASPKAKTALLKALELDGALPQAHVALANFRFSYEWDWSGAETEYRRAIDLNPNSADVHFFYADFLISMGRTKESTAEMERALELDPFNFFFQCFFGWHLVYLHRDDDAIAQLQKTLRAEPDFSSAHLGLWGAFYQKRMYEEAVTEAKKFFEVLGNRAVSEALMHGYQEAGYSQAMRLAAEELTSRSKQTYVPAFRIARLYGHAGDKDQTLAWLDKAYEQGETSLIRLAVGWDWHNLRDDPRFRALVRRMNFPNDPLSSGSW